MKRARGLQAKQAMDARSARKTKARKTSRFRPPVGFPQRGKWDVYFEVGCFCEYPRG